MPDHINLVMWSGGCFFEFYRRSSHIACPPSLGRYLYDYSALFLDLFFFLGDFLFQFVH